MFAIGGGQFFVLHKVVWLLCSMTLWVCVVVRMHVKNSIFISWQYKMVESDFQNTNDKTLYDLWLSNYSNHLGHLIATVLYKLIARKFVYYLINTTELSEGKNTQNSHIHVYNALNALKNAWNIWIIQIH